MGQGGLLPILLGHNSTNVILILLKSTGIQGIFETDIYNFAREDSLGELVSQKFGDHAQFLYF